jgi:hypothetical protein
MTVIPEAQALLTRGGRTALTRSRRIREPVSGIEKVLDVVSRPEYAIASAFREVWRGRPERAGGAFYRGFTAEQRLSFQDIAREEFGLSEQSVFGVPDVGWIPDQIEELARSFTSPAGFVGLGMGILLDPLSWTGAGMLTKGGRLARKLGRGVGEGIEIGAGGRLVFPKKSGIEAGSDLARRWEDEFARTGRLPEALASTWGEQAAKSQRAFLQVVTPFGRPLMTVIPGVPAFRAATQLSQAMQRIPQVRQLLQTFSHFGFDPRFMTFMAELRAKERRPAEFAIRAMAKLGRLLDTEAGIEHLPDRKSVIKRMLHPMEASPRLDGERLGQLSGTAAAVDRTVGTGAFTVEAAEEVRGRAWRQQDRAIGQSAVNTVREGLGLVPGAPLVKVEGIGDLPLSALEEFRVHGQFMGVEFRGQFNDQVGRVLIDVDQIPRPESIRKSMEELKRVLPKLTDERELAQALEAMNDLERALGFAKARGEQRIWRLLAYATGPDGQEQVVGMARAKSLEELQNGIWKEIVDRVPVENFEGSVIYMTDELRDALVRRGGKKGHLERILDERARLAARSRESVAGISPYVTDPDLDPDAEAIRLLIQGLDPDVIELERIDRLIERISTAPRVKGLRKQTPAAMTIRQLAEPTVIDRMGTGRFRDLPSILRQAALELEEVNDLAATVETARGLLRTRKQNYVVHLLNDDLSQIPWINSFARQPMQLPTTTRFARRRKIEDEILEINRLADREVFHEDIVAATGVRVAASAKATGYHDFIHQTLDQFGEQVDPSDAEGIRRLLAQRGPQFGAYQPFGPLRFYPTNTVSEASLWRGRARAEATAEEAFEAGRRAEAGARKRQGLIEITEDDIRRGVGISKQTPVFIVPREVANHLNRVEQINNTPEGLRVAASVLRSFRNTWSKFTLFLFPGYVARNMAGNVSQMVYSGFTDGNLFLEARKIQQGKHWKGVTAAGKEIDDQYILQHCSRLNMIDSGWAMSEAIADAGPQGRTELMILRRIQREGLQGARKVFEEMREPAVMRFMMRMNGWAENNAKIALFMDRTLKGDTPELAAEVVRKHLFDYDELRPAEQFLRAFVFPYYVWTRKNLSLQMEFLMKQPGRFAALSDFQRLIEAGTNADQEVLPQWMHESFPVRLAMDKKKGEFQYFILRNWLPAAELQSLFTPGHTAMGMLAPWLRLPVERRLNYSFYFRRPIESFGGQKGVFLGASLRRKDIEFLRGVRLLSELDRILPAPADSPLAPYQAPMTERLFGSSLAGIGLKTYAIDFQRQARVARGQHERILRELRIMKNRAKKRRDLETLELLEEKIRQEQARDPNVVLPLGITGLPTEP